MAFELFSYIDSLSRDKIDYEKDDIIAALQLHPRIISLDDETIKSQLRNEILVKWGYDMLKNGKSSKRLFNLLF